MFRDTLTNSVYLSSLMRTLLLVPSIFHKIDDLLIVKELNMQLFNNSIREDLLYMAVTTVSAEQEHNYERLELLGESHSEASFTVD